MPERDTDRLVLAAPTRPDAGNEHDWLIGQALALMHAGDKAAHHQLEQALGLIGRHSDAVVQGVKERIDGSRDDPMLCWSLLWILDRAGVVDALHLFAQEASRPIRRDEDSDGCEHWSDLEQLVAIEAAEALVHLAERGIAEAVDALFDVVTNQRNGTVRGVAARGVASARPEARERLIEVLGEDRNVLDHERVGFEKLAVDFSPFQKQGRRDHVGSAPPLSRRRGPLARVQHQLPHAPNYHDDQER
jgi:hypothetical protein